MTRRPSPPIPRMKRFLPSTSRPTSLLSRIRRLRRLRGLASRMIPARARPPHPPSLPRRRLLLLRPVRGPLRNLRDRTRGCRIRLRLRLQPMDPAPVPIPSTTPVRIRGFPRRRRRPSPCSATSSAPVSSSRTRDPVRSCLDFCFGFLRVERSLQPHRFRRASLSARKMAHFPSRRGRSTGASWPKGTFGERNLAKRDARRKRDSGWRHWRCACPPRFLNPAGSDNVSGFLVVFAFAVCSAWALHVRSAWCCMPTVPFGHITLIECLFGIGNDPCFPGSRRRSVNAIRLKETFDARVASSGEGVLSRCACVAGFSASQLRFGFVGTGASGHCV